MKSMAYEIPKRRLGNTDIDATIVGLGGAGVGSNSEITFFGRPIEDDIAVETVRTALDSGINLIDTSPLYGDSQRKIGLVLKDYGKRDSFILSTKAGTHPVHKGYSGEAFMRSIEDSLIQLSVDYVDILHIHDPDEAGLEQALSKGGAVEAMVKMREEGLIRYFGLGGRPHDLHRRFIESGSADVILPFLDYNLLRQDAKNLLNLCGDNNVGVMVGTPLCFGYLSGKDPRAMPKIHHDVGQEVDLDIVNEMYDWCISNGANLQQVNLNFILDNPNVGTVLIGSASPQEVRENIAAVMPINQELYQKFLKDFDLLN